MTFKKLNGLLEADIAPVVLLEGIRALPEEETANLSAMGARLAVLFPNAVFRTGNAKGSDEAFAAGVATIAPSQLQYVLPYAGHRRRSRPPQSRVAILASLPQSSLAELVEVTAHVSPHYRSLVRRYRDGSLPSRQRSVAQMILRDTLKVAGAYQRDGAPPDAGDAGDVGEQQAPVWNHAGTATIDGHGPVAPSTPARAQPGEPGQQSIRSSLLRATVGLFFVNPDNPDTGGTGHTIRACRYFNVPVMTQFDWR